MKPILVLKIGGNVVDSPELLEKVLLRFSKIKSDKIIVHGGGKIASDLSLKLGVSPKIIDGRRVTDAETLKIVVMVYAGLVNKTIVSVLQKNNSNAIGLSGADGNFFKTKKRISQIDYGFVGDAFDSSVNEKFLFELLGNNLLPVVSSITHDGDGQLLNTNADTIASSIAVALSKTRSVKLIYCFEKSGVLENQNDENSLIENLTYQKFLDLKISGAISSGMIPKLENVFSSLKSGIQSVLICGATAFANSDSIDEIKATRFTF